MDDLSSKSCLVYGYSASVALARRLSREFGRVQLFCPWKGDLPESVKLALGTGYPEIERVRHFNDALLKNDLVVFPEIYDGDLQRDCVNRGLRVWGSRKGERLEYDRPFFLETLEKVGLPVPEYEICQGIDELEEYLEEHENCWVKMNLRGDGETWQHKTPELTKRRIEVMRHQWGPIASDITFTVVAHIESESEVAYDGFFVTSRDGKPKFPDIGFLGYETKNLSHILRAIPYDDFPDQVRHVNDLFGPALAEYCVRSGFGTEIRDEFFLDATCRQPCPPGEIIMEQVTNLGEFFWHGSEGDLIPFETEEEFGVQVALTSDTSKTNWSAVTFPEEIDRWVKLSRCCFREGVNQIIPDLDVTVGSGGSEHIGFVVALGKSIEAAMDLAKEYCEQVDGPGLSNEYESLASCLKSIHEGEEEGIEFAAEIPEPESVIQDG